MRTCKARYIRLDRDDQVYLSWPITGLGAATVEASLEEGTAVPLIVDGDSAGAYFAGPAATPVGDPIVVPVTSHVDIRVVTETTAETFDGGFIQLIP